MGTCPATVDAVSGASRVTAEIPSPSSTDRSVTKQRMSTPSSTVYLVNSARTQNGHIRNDTREVLGLGASETERSRHI
jgi:hypothetical protein